MSQDGLQPIVQRMIDAGESEENIATVIRHHAAQAPAAPSTPVSASEPGTFWGGVKKSLVEQATHAMGGTDAHGMPVFHASTPEVEQFATTPLARPTGIDKVDAFLSPASLAMMAAGGAVGGAGGALKRGAVAAKNKLPISGTLRMGASMVEGAPSSLKKWTPFAETGPEHLRNAAQWAKDKQMGVTRGAAQYEMPPSQRIVERAPRAAQVIGEPGTFEPPLPAQDLTRSVQPGSQTSAEMAARAQAVREAGGLPPQQPMPSTQPTVGQLRMATGQGGQSAPTLSTPTPGPVVEPTAIPSQLPAPPANWNTTVPDKVGSALDPARVDIGAEAAGRATGMTKQQVRDVATPILDAAPGEASPILPEAALKRMVDTLKAMPRGGPEREAYVAKATSGKTQWQIENIRRTLEHLGLIVPIAAGGAGMLRETIKNRLRGSEQPGQKFEQ